MKIIILSSSKKNSGGVERFSFYLQNCLEKAGYSVSILGREDIGVFGCTILKIKKFFGMEQPALGYFLGRKAVKMGFDVCITNGMLGWNIKNKKVINVQHGTFARAADRVDRNKNIFKFFVKKYIWGFFEGLAARRAVKCISVSEETKESVERYYCVKNSLIIPNATDTDFFKPMDTIMCRGKMKLPLDKKIALFVGRFEYAKGKNILEGIQEYLKNHNGELIVAENYSQEELALLYNSADVFLLPSLHEGCSYALLDAMSCELPFLASPVGLVSDFAHQGIFSECVVMDQNVQSYLEKIERLLDLKETEREVLKHELRNYILDKHILDKFAHAYEKLLQEIL